MTTDEDLIRTALSVATTAGPRDVPIGAVALAIIIVVAGILIKVTRDFAL